MKHQYKTEIFWKKCSQSIIDFIFDIFVILFLKIEKQKELKKTEKILFIVLAQLGDALVMSYVFPFIRERFPASRIDVLAGEWTKPIFENNPYIKDIIFFNHIRMNRKESSLLKKIYNHLNSSKSAVKKIRVEEYDISIEGGVTHPNGNILSYRGKVKKRIGFGSGGYGSLLTDEVPFPTHSGFHILEALLEELKIVGINKKLANIRPYFYSLYNSLSQNHPFYIYNYEPFIIIHPESGNSNRLLSEKFWLEVTKIIIGARDYKILICGTSQKSIELFNLLVANLYNNNRQIVNAVQKLSLSDFFLLSKYSKAVITAESLPAHLSAISCKTLSIYKNGSGSFFFPIPNIDTTVIHNHSPSKNVRIHNKIRNYYVNNFESEESFKIIVNFIKTL